MKITSGDYKYRKLEVPSDIRPTTEKVREAIFSMIVMNLPEANVLDLFAGSGAFGLEALSRGAARCFFNDFSKRNFAVLKKNVEYCLAQEKSIMFNYDFRKCLSIINDKLDIVFIDPPYVKAYNCGWYMEIMTLLQDYNILNRGAIVVVEHLYKQRLEKSYGSLSRYKDKRYGSIGVDIYT